jgi:hypothetical protein
MEMSEKAAVSGRGAAESTPPNTLADSAAVKLDRGLYEACKNNISGSQLREILQAAAGIKVSRVVLDDRQKLVLRSVAGKYGFAITDGLKRYSARTDSGKANFRNQRTPVGPNEAGFVFSYVARTHEAAKRAIRCDDTGDSEGLGELLAFPPCCREAYRRFEPFARKVQGDLVPQVWANSLNGLPFDPWLNIVVRYFGKAMISFFPCSFQCAAARKNAIESFNLMLACDHAWAESFLMAQCANVIYTEYEGIHVVRADAYGAEIGYIPRDLSSTASTRVAKLLLAGNRIRANGPQSVTIYRDSVKVGSIEGTGVFICLFRTSRSAML